MSTYILTLEESLNGFSVVYSEPTDKDMGTGASHVKLEIYSSVSKELAKLKFKEAFSNISRSVFYLKEFIPGDFAKAVFISKSDIFIPEDLT